MAFSIYKVIDISGSKIIAQKIDTAGTLGLSLINPATGQTYLPQYKFTFAKSSDFKVTTDENAEVEIEFNYKDNF